MPAVEALPEAIRALGRRQAVSLRDETWDADVDRLVAVTGSKAPPPSTRAKSAALAVALLAIVLLAATFMARRFRSADAAVTADRGRSGSDAAPPSPGRKDRAGTTGAPASAIAIPRSAEIVGADIIGVNLIYTLLSGGVARHDDTTTLSLRFRFPMMADLSSTGRPAETDLPDTGDALSHLILAPIISALRPLIAGTDVAYTQPFQDGRKGAATVDGNQGPTADRTRPPCEFPKWPKFTCATCSENSPVGFTCVHR